MANYYKVSIISPADLLGLDNYKHTNSSGIAFPGFPISEQYHTVTTASLTPSPLPPPAFHHLLYTQTRTENLVNLAM